MHAPLRLTCCYAETESVRISSSLVASIYTFMTLFDSFRAPARAMGRSPMRDADLAEMAMPMETNVRTALRAP